MWWLIALGAAVGLFSTAVNRQNKKDEIAHVKETAEDQYTYGKEFSDKQYELGKVFSDNQYELGKGFSDNQYTHGKEFSDKQYELGKVFSDKQYELGKEFSDNQWSIQKTEALGQLDIQRSNLDTHLGLTVDDYNTSLLAQAFGIQDAGIQTSSAIGADIVSEAMSGARGNSANEQIRAYAAQSLDRNIGLQEKQNDNYLNQLISGANMSVDAVNRERGSWGANGYRTQLKNEQDAYNFSIKNEQDAYNLNLKNEQDAYNFSIKNEQDAYNLNLKNEQDAYNLNMYELGISNYDWHLNQMNKPLNFISDYTAGGFQGANMGFGLYQGYESWMKSRDPWNSLGKKN